MEIPGLMVLAIVKPLRYVPLAVDGLALMIAMINSWLFSAIFSGAKDTRPTEAWMIPALSTLNAILPPFTSFTAPATSLVTVPVLGFGIRLRGPNILPRRPILGITDGVAIITSTSVHPPSIF